jgi:hypothetical protein
LAIDNSYFYASLDWNSLSIFEVEQVALSQYVLIW